MKISMHSILMDTVPFWVLWATENLHSPLESEQHVKGGSMYMELVGVHEMRPPSWATTA